MAITTPTSDLNHRSNGIALETVVSHVCKQHGLNKIDFVSLDQNPADGDVILRFKGLALPAKFEAPVDLMKRMLADSLRGPVIRAAVPDFSAAAQRMLMLLEQMQGPYIIRVTCKQIENILRKP